MLSLHKDFSPDNDGEGMQTFDIVVYSDPDLVFTGRREVSQVTRITRDKRAKEHTGSYVVDSFPKSFCRGILVNIYV